jgi:two-component system OmpR family sensor kinase
MALSVRNLLVAWHSVILAILLFVFTGGLYLSLSYHLNQEVNESLLSWAAGKLGPLGSMGHGNGMLPDRKGGTALPESFSLVLNDPGRMANENPLEPMMAERIRALVESIAIPASGGPVEKNVVLDGHPFRLLIFDLNRAGAGSPGRLVVGRSLVHVQTTIHELSIFLGVLWLLAVAVCAMVSWMFVGRTLRPVKAMTRASLQIAASGKLGKRIGNFSGAADEFGELSQALNQMLSTLESAYLTQKKFLADASHELRTPLTSVRANLEFLQRAPDLGEAERHQIVREAGVEVNRMARLVDELLWLAREESQAPPQLRPVDLGEIAREAVSGLQYRAAATERTIAIRAPERAAVWGDPEKLTQLIINLLDNALKYTAAGGRIEVELSVRERRTLLRVADDGPGIPEAELPLVFNRFYRAGNAAATTGSGLGLAIAKSIVASHQAEIRLNNRSPHGLAVEVLFPPICPVSDS